MASSKFVLFAATLEGFTDYCVNDILRTFRHELTVPQYPGENPLEKYPLEMVKDALFTGVLRLVLDKPDKMCPSVDPEETAAELIHRGVPKESISAGYTHVTATLPHADFRMLRTINGNLAGSVRISKPGSSSLVHTQYDSTELAEFILLLDPLLPTIDKAAETLYRKMEEELRCKQAREKAQEIARKTIETLLEKALPGLGLSCKFTISENTDRVRLELTRREKAEIDIPLSELDDFLADPQKVEATLTVDNATPVDEKRPFIPRPLRPFSPFASHITFNPPSQAVIEI